MTYLPDGFRSARNGVLSDTAWKSSMVSLMPTALAMAIRCKTAFVLPPRIFTTIIAFSKACRVRMSRGRISSLSRFLTASPIFSHSVRLLPSSAGLLLLPGTVMPNVSIAVASVFAVYIPPQAPAPGHALRMISNRCSSFISPARYCPYDWNALTKSNGWSLALHPGLILPP